MTSLTVAISFRDVSGRSKLIDLIISNAKTKHPNNQSH